MAYAEMLPYNIEKLVPDDSVDTWSAVVTRPTGLVEHSCKPGKTRSLFILTMLL